MFMYLAKKGIKQRRQVQRKERGGFFGRKKRKAEGEKPFLLEKRSGPALI